MLDEALKLAREGLSLHWLRSPDWDANPKGAGKAPIDGKWSSAPFNKPADLEATYRDGYNLGFRPGEPSEIADGLYLYVIDVDVKGDRRDGDEAFEALKTLLPHYESYPWARSGRGGDNCHIYVCAEQISGKIDLAKSRKRLTWKDGAGKEHTSNAWEIQLLGTGQNVVLPPSIHPDTQKAYKWEREIDFDSPDEFKIDIDELTEIAGADGEERDDDSRSSTRDDSSRSLSEVAKSRPLPGIDANEAWDVLKALPFEKWAVDYDGWLKVGMALHHQFQGSPEGLELWHDFSRDADNYEEDALDDKWKSFGKDKRRTPVRFATLIAAANTMKAIRQYKGVDDDDDDFELEDDDEWLAQLTRNDKGFPESTSDNVAMILANDVRFKGLFGQNRFVEDACIVREPVLFQAKSEKRQAQMRQLDSWIFQLSPVEKREGKPLEDAHYHEIRLVMESPISRGGHRIKVSDRDLHAAISALANRNPYHPVQQYLSSLQWDGKSRLDYLFVDYLGCPEDEYHIQTARLFMIAAVARVFQPGHKFDFVPILEGPQGIRKSSFIHRLARHWFVELNADCFDDPKKAVELLLGQWIAEIPELHGFTRADIAAVKAFFSKNEEKVREAYGRKAKKYQRQSVYMGTTNDREYLRDPTGNRRFWPIQVLVDLIDTDKLDRNMSQLWAEAYERYRELAADYPPGRLPLFLKGDEAKRIALELQESRVVETQSQGWAGKISEWANTRVPMSVIEGKGEDFERQDGRPDPLVKRELICAIQVWNEVFKGSDESYGRGNSLKVIEAIRATGEWIDAGRTRVPKYGLQRVFKRAPKPKRTVADILG